MVSIHRGRECHDPLEAVVESLSAKTLFGVFLFFCFALPRDSQGVAVKRDVDVLLLQARQLNDDREVIFVLINVQSGRPAAQRSGRAKEGAERGRL